MGGWVKGGEGAETIAEQQASSWLLGPEEIPSLCRLISADGSRRAYFRRDRRRGKWGLIPFRHGALACVTGVDAAFPAVTTEGRVQFQEGLRLQD